MPYCSRCGVEVDEGVPSCPLCRAPIQRLDEGEARPGLKPWPEHVVPDELPPLSAKERLKFAVEIAAVSMGIALAMLLLIDLLSNRRVTWSAYPATGLVFGWLCLAVPFFLGRRPWLVLAALGPAAFLLLFLLDAIDGSIEWFPSYGLPIAAIALAAVASVALASALAKKRGLNVVGFAFLGAAFVCTGIDLTVGLNRGRGLAMRWSVPVDFALVPIAAFLIYLHYRVTKKVDMRKAFHL